MKNQEHTIAQRDPGQVGNLRDTVEDRCDYRDVRTIPNY